KDTEALNLARKVIIMGGAYFKQYADWNVMCDVTAADIMFRNLTNLECMGADVTHLLRAEKEIMDYVSSYNGDNSSFGYISELYNMWYNAGDKPHLVFHDALVVYYAMNPEICTAQRATVAVICDGAARGMTLNVDAYTKAYMNGWYSEQCLQNKAVVACNVDLDAFNSKIKLDIIKCANGY
ncbi:MAG: nucleoside hydrolase, partial [Clostridia bacterium]|nr:nucleoside hydrolase [Clostridia bacterium]